MCTVILRVPDAPDEPVRLLAIRDEDPDRAWDPPAAWWPDTRPGVVGVRDRRAGGAWLAADDDERRLAVLLNRAEPGPTLGEVRSRGAIVLDSATGRTPDDDPRTPGFNLVEVDAHSARVRTWDGVRMSTVQLAPGTHMIAHDGVDDAATPRIARWLGEFSAAAIEPGDEWRDEWMALLERSAALAPTDDRAIVRDNRPHGYPTLSLLVCAATVGADGVDLVYGEFDRPGEWNRPQLVASGSTSVEARR